jgi:diadenosine tetraphosphate (Ap4A) HIT family hydrolase
MICGEHMDPMTCPFCSPHADMIVAMNELSYARWDRYPVSKGHMLVIPFRHVQDFFDLTGEEKCAILDWFVTVSG